VTAQDSGPIRPVTSAQEALEVVDATLAGNPPEAHKYFTREQLLARADGSTLEKREVEVPGLGWCQMTELTVKQQDVIRDSSMKPPVKKGGEPVMDISSFRRKMVIESLLQPKLEASDFEILGGLGGKTFNVMQDVAMDLNGVTDASVKGAESDSETTQS
jgi:hypothetical protein